MDPKHTKKRSELPDKTREGPKHVSKDMSSSHALKCCSLCSTTKTPLWRGGPSGPKSLCNACGIRYRKKRRERVGCKGKRRAGFDGGAHMRRYWGAKVGFLGLILRLRWSRERLAEEEEAAILLMALSSGFLYGLKS